MSRFRKLSDWYFSKKAAPYWLIILMDCFIFMAVWVFVYAFFLGPGALMQNFWPLMRTVLLFLLPHIVFYRIFHTYNVVVRFSSFVDLLRILYAVFCGTAVDFVLHFFTNMDTSGFFTGTRSVHIILVGAATALVMMLVRVIVKYLYDTAYKSDNAQNVFIYGIMAGGVGVAKSIRDEKPARFRLKGFITHDNSLSETHLLGEKIYNVDDKLPKALKDNDIKAVLVTPMRTERFRRDQQLQDYIISSGCKIYISEHEEEWDPESSQSPVFREVKIEDLLPREQISMDMESIGEMLRGQRIVITGSAGSIGSEMVRQIAAFGPEAMLLLDQAETPQHDVRLEMAHDFPGIKVSTVVTSISHSTRIDKMFREFRPDYVFHAAAYKHVPMMEDNPQEAVLNNVYGTKVIADASVRYGVKKFVMISTDKAVNPTNVMGCSKRICEIYCQSLNRAVAAGKVPGVTQFVTTRFGNVLGSNGSVIPLFRRQIKEGGPVTVTDPNIVRFFMLIPEACKLVLEAGTKGNGGEIFVFDMGEPVKIADLAKRMITLSGAQDVEIKYTGLREGEKLYEEVLSNTENTKPSFHEKIRIAEVREYDYDVACRQVDDLVAAAKTYDPMATVKVMKEIVPEYISNNSVYEVLDRK